MPELTRAKTRILIVDDDVELLKSCTKILANNGFSEIVTINDSDEAAKEIQSGTYDLFISDLSMPGYSGMELLNIAKKAVPETPFVIFSAYGTTERVVEAMKEGAFDFIEKPFKADRLRVVVEKSLRYRNLHKEKQALEVQLQEKYNFGNIIGKSPVMQNVFDMIARVSEGDANITITGESGTGKELVARSIHAHSERKNQAFVPVNCGAFPENLFESELFGYEKGAFTGANRRKHGLLEYANEGTFFLDEICELSPTLQVKLLRMLQERKIRRVGGSELIDIDVRIISATNCIMEEALQKGWLREDLYYRLNVISINLPPLRKRKEDIPILANHFVEKFGKTTPKKIEGIAEETLRCLEAYNWPGNVRELENVIERAVTLTTSKWLQPRDLPDNIVSANSDMQSVQIDLPLKEAKERMIAHFEREYLTKMLKRHNGNISRAAVDSGIDRRTLHRMINRLDLKPRNWSSLDA